MCAVQSAPSMSSPSCVGFTDTSAFSLAGRAGWGGWGMGRDPAGGFGRVARVLAEVREGDGDTEPVLFARGDQRLVERLARHEAAHGEFHESAGRPRGVGA